MQDELAARLAADDVTYRLAVQHYVSEAITPVEDGAIEWTEENSPSIEIATLRIPKQDILARDGMDSMAAIDRLAFNPWNAPAEFRPLGNLNRARSDVYGKSADHWQKSAFTANS